VSGCFLDRFMKSGMDRVVFAARLALRVHRRLQEFHGRNTRDLDRVLERQEHAGRRPLVRLHVEHVLTVEQDLAFGDFIQLLRLGRRTPSAAR
jgi:hypothetical protein